MQNSVFWASKSISSEQAPCWIWKTGETWGENKKHPRDKEGGWRTRWLPDMWTNLARCCPPWLGALCLYMGRMSSCKLVFNSHLSQTTKWMILAKVPIMNIYSIWKFMKTCWIITMSLHLNQISTLNAEKWTDSIHQVLCQTLICVFPFQLNPLWTKSYLNQFWWLSLQRTPI